MKSALVLGLALTASAFSAGQHDNELIIAPTDQLGTIKPYPGNIRFDEEGNDLFSFKAPRYRNLTNRFPGVFLDDELMRGPYGRRRRSHDAKEEKPSYNEADNEFPARGKAAAAKKYRPGLAEYAKMHPETVFYDEADDELVIAPVDGTGKENRRRFDDVERRKVYDEFLVRPVSIHAVDDELIRAPKTSKNSKDSKNSKKQEGTGNTGPHMSSKLFVERRAEALKRNEADDELLVRSVGPYGAADADDDELLWMPSRLFDERRAEALRLDDEVDDEFHSNPKMSSKLFVERHAEALRKDDEADNELAWLDDLVKEAPGNGAIFRLLDDELRAEKLGHLKGNHVRDNELPEIRGRVRPLGDGGFLPFN